MDQSVTSLHSSQHDSGLDISRELFDPSARHKFQHLPKLADLQKHCICVNQKKTNPGEDSRLVFLL